MKVDSSIRSHVGKILAGLSVVACAFLATPVCGEDARPETDLNARVPIALVVDDEALRRAMMSLDQNANDVDDVQGQIDRTLRECESRIAEIVRDRLGMDVHVQRVVGVRLFIQMLNDERIRSLKEGLARAQVENKKKEGEIEALKTEKSAVEDQLLKAKADTEAVKEDLEEEREKVERLMNMLKARSAAPRAAADPVTGGGRLTNGDKGTILAVDEKAGYALVKFDGPTLDELIGADRTGALPPHEMLVVRKAWEAGKASVKVVGKIRLRQWMPQANLVGADILRDWQQVTFEKGDVVRPD